MRFAAWIGMAVAMAAMAGASAGAGKIAATADRKVTVCMQYGFDA